MDQLRPGSLYRIRAKLFRDEPTDFHMRWFWVPSSTPAMGPWHRYASGVWHQGFSEPDDVVGERKGARRHWDRGLPPVMPPQVVGTQADFFDGPLSTDAPHVAGPSVCCCPPKDAWLRCVTECPQCEVMARLWELRVPFKEANGLESHGGLYVYVTWDKGCSFSNRGVDLCPRCDCMPRVWYVQFDSPCNLPGPQYIAWQGGCVFTSCRPAPPDF